MKFVKYILIIVLSFGVYFINKRYESQVKVTYILKQDIQKIEQQLSQKTKNSKKLQHQIQILKKSIVKLKKQNKQKDVVLFILPNDEEVQKSTQKNEENKTIKIVLPETKIDYSKIIPDVNYSDIDLSKDNKTKKFDDKMKVVPNVTFDKEYKINSLNLKIQTKF